MRGLSWFGAALTGAALVLFGAAGALWYSGYWPGRSPEPAETVDTVASAAAAVQTQTSVSLADLELLLSVMDAGQKAQVLASEESFSKFVQQEALNQSVIRAAVANQAERNPVVAELMQRAALRVLAQVYMNQVVATNLEAGFPSDDQLRTWFEANSDQFMTPDRVHLWQIFLPVAADASAADVASTEQRANDIALSLKQGKTDFAAEAARSSAHIQSRLSDGYMGLLRVDELLPEIRSAVQAMADEGVSVPIRSSTGFHIIRRGAVVKGQPLKLDEVAPQARALLRREAETKVRQAAADKIKETYPTAIGIASTEEWRTQLLAAKPAAESQVPAQ